MHFDPVRKLALSCDASPYGIGAVLLHLYDDGLDLPIVYASRSLAPAEKEGLSDANLVVTASSIRKWTKEIQ